MSRQSLGMAIEMRRKFLKIRQTPMAAKLKISQSKFSKIENGKLELSFAEAVSVSRILGWGLRAMVKEMERDSK